MYTGELNSYRTEEECLRALDKAHLKMLLCAMLPVIKISVDKYLIGTTVKTLHVNQDKLMLATGGGYTELRVWMQKNALLQSIKLAKMILDTPG